MITRVFNAQAVDANSASVDTGRSNFVTVQLIGDALTGTALVQQSLNGSDWVTKSSTDDPISTLLTFPSAPFTRVVLEDAEAGTLTAYVEAVRLGNGAAMMTGASESADGAAGIVPTPVIGDEAKFLRGDATFAAAIASIAPLVIADTSDVHQRDGTNPQTFRIYNTYTDGANHERGTVGWISNRFTIAATASGTGTQRELDLDGSLIRCGATLYTYVTADLGTSTAPWLALYLSSGIQGGTSVFVIDDTATTVASVTIPTGETRGGTLEFSVQASAGASREVVMGTVKWAVINVSGTLTVVLSTPETTRSPSGGTLVITPTAVDAGSGVLALKLTPVSDLTTPTYTAYVRVNPMQPCTVTFPSGE